MEYIGSALFLPPCGEHQYFVLSNDDRLLVQLFLFESNHGEVYLAYTDSHALTDSGFTPVYAAQMMENDLWTIDDPTVLQYFEVILEETEAHRTQMAALEGASPEEKAAFARKFAKAIDRRMEEMDLQTP